MKNSLDTIGNRTRDLPVCVRYVPVTSLGITEAVNRFSCKFCTIATTQHAFRISYPAVHNTKMTSEWNYSV